MLLGISILCIVYAGITSYKYNNILQNVIELQKLDFHDFQTNLEEIVQTLEKMIQEPTNNELHIDFKQQTGYVVRSYDAYIASRMINNSINSTEREELNSLFSIIWNQIRGNVMKKSESDLVEAYHEIKKAADSIAEYRQ